MMLSVGPVCLDEEDAGGEDGSRGGGTGARRRQHHRFRGEHADGQPLWPAGEDLEPRAAGQTGKQVSTLESDSQLQIHFY